MFHLVAVMTHLLHCGAAIKVPRRLQECVTDHFLAETPVTALYDKLRVDFYFPVLYVILARLRERFAGKNKMILDGVAALQFDATVMKSDLDKKIHAVREFAALYAYLGISIEQCSVQFELAAQNKLLTDRMPKTLKSAGLCSLNTSLPMCTPIWQSF